jgi:hypothetical protein
VPTTDVALPMRDILAARTITRRRPRNVTQSSSTLPARTEDLAEVKVSLNNIGAERLQELAIGERNAAAIHERKRLLARRFSWMCTFTAVVPGLGAEPDKAMLLGRARKRPSSSNTARCLLSAGDKSALHSWERREATVHDVAPHILSDACSILHVDRARRVQTASNAVRCAPGFAFM